MRETRDDDSNRIVAAWQKERPDLDTSPMLVFSRLSRLSRYFDLERRRAFAAHDLEPWEFDVLAVLRRSGSPYAATPGTLMAELLVSSGTMTNRIDRLEHKGLVERRPSPLDRRATLVYLTSGGRSRVDDALQTLLDSERKILQPMTSEQQETLAHLLFPPLFEFESEDPSR